MYSHRYGPGVHCLDAAVLPSGVRMRSDQLPGQAVLTSAVDPDGMEWPFDTWLAMMHTPSLCTFLHGLLELDHAGQH